MDLPTPGILLKSLSTALSMAESSALVISWSARGVKRSGRVRFGLQPGFGGRVRLQGPGNCSNVVGVLQEPVYPPTCPGVSDPPMPDATRRLIGVTVLTLLYPAVAPLAQRVPNPMPPGASGAGGGLLAASPVAAALPATSLRQFAHCSDRW